MLGDMICVDKSSSKWTGLGAWYDAGMPHITICASKLWNLAMEFKDSMHDVCSQAMLQMQICEGKDAAAKEYMELQGMKAGTAMALRPQKKSQAQVRQDGGS